MKDWQWAKYSAEEQERIRCHAELPVPGQSRWAKPTLKRCDYRSLEGKKFCRIHPEGNKFQEEKRA